MKNMNREESTPMDIPNREAVYSDQTQKYVVELKDANSTLKGLEQFKSRTKFKTKELVSLMNFEKIMSENNDLITENQSLNSEKGKKRNNS